MNKQVRTLFSFLSMTRPVNVAMASVATLLGWWLSGHSLEVMPLFKVILLCLAAAGATAFGNVVNDMVDVASDRISHPERPLPSGTISHMAALIGAYLLACASIACALSVSLLHGTCTIIPLVLLLVYALKLKSTRIAGNLTVALLVACPLLFGGLPGPALDRLFLPALLAFLLNFSREIIKDLQDREGDRAAGYTTTATLCEQSLKTVLFSVTLVYLSCLFLPSVTGHFGLTYALLCAVVVLPLHAARTAMIASSDWTKRLQSSSALLKGEMAAGLIALAADNLVRW